MSTSVRYRTGIHADYDERVYSGLLGKLIGVGLGRRYLAGTRTPSPRELGKIGYDLAARGDFSPLFAEDGICAALTAVRALEDFPFTSSLGSDAIAQTWLNYAIEQRAVLWWGGKGHSAAHTAYLNLKRGIVPPASGSAELNGTVVAEQHGAEASAECWGMLFPQEPERAADFAARAARVCYSGEAVHTAQAVAAMVSSAFAGGGVDAILNAATLSIPAESSVAKMIVEIRAWHATGEEWPHTRERILERFGGTEFGEWHAVPHFAGVVLALAAGKGDLKDSFALAAAAGWGTAANLGVIGSILGVHGGITNIDVCSTWRASVADRIYLPSADAGRCVSDAANEALALARIARDIARVAYTPPKKGARFHFELPGSMHGFTVECSGDSPGLAMVRNVTRKSRCGKRCLALIFSGVDAQRCARVATPVFPPCEKDGDGRSAAIPGSPTLYPGQTIRAYVEANADNKCQAGVRPFIRYYGDNDEPRMLRGPEKWLMPDSRHEFQWTLPRGFEARHREGTLILHKSGAVSSTEPTLLQGRPIIETGLEIFSDEPADGVIYLDYFTWDGVPSVDLGPPHTAGRAWQCAWVNAATQCDFGKGAAVLRVCQNEGVGMVIQGTRQWTDYCAVANVTPRMVKSAGIAVRVQGLQRYYALLLTSGNKLRLVKQLYGTSVLAEADLAWIFGQTVELSLSVEGKRLKARANGKDYFELDDPSQPFDGGAYALVVEEGCVESGAVRIGAVE